MKSIGTYNEKAKELIVYGKYDVIVVGGGVAGFPAAIAAARGGAKTLIIERFPFFGGTATASLMANIVGFRNQVDPCDLQTTKGIGEEFILKMIEDGSAVKSKNSYPSKPRSDTKGDLSYCYVFDTERFKYFVMKMVIDAGVDILFHTYFSDVIIDEEKKVNGIIIENKSGRQAIYADIVIDASGDGDVAFKADIPFWQTKKDEASRLNDTLMYKVEGFPEDTNAGGNIIGKSMILWGPNPGGNNAADADELTAEEISVRLSVFDDLENKRKKQPKDYKGAYVSDTGCLIGVRQTRFFEGVYQITGDDVLSGRWVEDGISMAANPVIHHYGYRRFLEHEGYQIPYRALMPKAIDNMYVIGRCMSSDQIAYESWRAMAPIMNIGEAAGTAAAICIKDKVLPKQIDVKKLQNKLIENGCEIGQGKTNNKN